MSRTVAAVLAVAIALAACAGDGDDGTTPDAAAPTAADDGPVGGGVLAGAEVERAPADAPNGAAALAAGLDDVGFDVLRAVAATTDGDVVVSPLSIGIAFGMADVGASEPAAGALQELFAYPVAGEERWAAFNTLEQEVSADGGEGVPTVRLANRMFPDESFATVEGYDELLGRWFGVAVEPLPLRARSEESRAHINRWVDERTEQLIPELLPEGFVNPQTVLVLVNALYLQADWARPFGKYPTTSEPFTRLDGSTVAVPLMHELELRGPAVSTDRYAATEVPYVGDELSMLVIVPTAGNYDAIEAELSRALLDEIDAAATETSVELFLPRFSSATTVDLRGVLEGDLGVEGLFSTESWDGIAPGITLEQAVHAADITVDEQGTEAAAATALGFEESGPPTPEVTVRADRPFLYVIRHRPTGSTLFAGRVTDPAS